MTDIQYRPPAAFGRGQPLTLKADDGDAAPVVETTEIKTALADLHKAVADQREALGKEVAELKKGHADAVRTGELDKLNDRIEKAEARVAELATAQRRRAAAPAGDLPDEAIAHRKAFADWARGVEGGDLRGVERKAYAAVEAMKSAISSDGPSGGFLVPIEQATEVEKRLREQSPIRAIASVQTIGAATHKRPVQTGFADYRWAGEVEARSKTGTPRVEVLEFPAQTLHASPMATEELLEDAAVNVEQWLAGEVSDTFAIAEGEAFVTGAGPKRPRGFLSYDTVADASHTWGKLGHIATGKAAGWGSDPTNNLLDAVYAIKEGYRAGARWVMNRRLLAQIRRFQDGAGNYIWQPSIAAGQPASLLGYPITEADHMPNVAANSLSVAFGDFRRGYLIVDRSGIRTLRDPYTEKPFIIFDTTKRVGGGVKDFDAIKLIKFSQT